MLKIFYGPNLFAKRVELEQLKSDSRKNYGDFAVREFSAEDLNPNEFASELISTGLFATNELLIVRSAEDNLELIEVCLKSAEGSHKDVILLINALDKRTIYYKDVSKSSGFKDFPQLLAPKLANWISEVSKNLGFKLSSTVTTDLINRADSDQQEIWLCLNQLALLNNKEITSQDLDTFLPIPAAESAFDLLEFALKKNYKGLDQTLQELELYREDPYQIIGLLCSQTHSITGLWYGKQAGKDSRSVASDLGIHPYAASQQARLVSSAGLDKNKLSRLVESMRWLDVSLKTINKTEPWPMIDAALKKVALI